MPFIRAETAVGARSAQGHRRIDPAVCARNCADGVPSARITDCVRMKNHPHAIGDLI
jgi:hypothetical protein